MAYYFVRLSTSLYDEVSFKRFFMYVLLLCASAFSAFVIVCVTAPVGHQYCDTSVARQGF